MGWTWGGGVGGGVGAEDPFCSCDAGGDCECLCSAIATYADECARHGLHVRWRSQELCRECARPLVPGIQSLHSLSSLKDTSPGLRAIHSLKGRYTWNVPCARHLPMDQTCPNPCSVELACCTQPWEGPSKRPHAPPCPPQVSPWVGSPAAVASWCPGSEPRQSHLHPALQCEGGKVYEACGHTCPPTCHDRGLEPGWHCQAVACVEGCFCPGGALLHGGWVGSGCLGGGGRHLGWERFTRPW